MSERADWSPVSLAFGAITGAVIAIALQPLLELLKSRLAEELITNVVDHAVAFGLPIFFAYAAGRVKRLDHFLRDHLALLSTTASVILTSSIWLYAGRPTMWLAVLAVVLTLIESWMFLLMCGGTMQLGLSQIRGKQAAEYDERREREARAIAERAVASGDLDAAVATFSYAAAGAASKGLMAGCLSILLVTFHFVAVFVVSTIDAHILFTRSLVWAAVIGVIIATGSQQLLVMSGAFGARYAETVPLEEKYRGIESDDDLPE